MDPSNPYEREAQLTHEDAAAIRAALVNAYPNLQFLFLRIRDKWGVEVDDVIFTQQPKLVVVDAIVGWARGEGKLLQLLALAWTDKPGNPQLDLLSADLLADRDAVVSQFSLPPLSDMPTAPAIAVAHEALERIVNDRSRFVDVTQFIARLQKLSGAICRVTAHDDIGTGFLVGRQAVLTNYHVVKTALEQAMPGEQILCEFDFHGAAANLVSRKGAPGTAWIGPSSPYSQSDLRGLGEPDPGSLDFALILLDSGLENDREPLLLSDQPAIVSPLDPVAIIQHPGGDAQQIAWGNVLEYPASGMRYRYDVTTLGGSSGSPVMSADLNLIALHHAADPATAPEYNQGVPIWRVAKAIAAGGLDLAQL